MLQLVNISYVKPSSTYLIIKKIYIKIMYNRDLQKTLGSNTMLILITLLYITSFYISLHYMSTNTLLHDIIMAITLADSLSYLWSCKPGG